MNWPNAVNVRCPYYINETGKTITCEGYECERITLRCKTAAEKETYRMKYCNFYPNNCILARAIDEMYE